LSNCLRQLSRHPEIGDTNTTNNLKAESSASADYPGRPSAMRLFDAASADRIFTRTTGAERTTVGIYCNIVPPELIHSAGFKKMELCALGKSDDGTDCANSGTCPVVTDSLACLLDDSCGMAAKLDLIVIPTTCGCKGEIAEVLEGLCRIHVMRVPSEREPEHLRDFWRGEVLNLFRRLQELRGGAISRRRLADSIRLHLDCAEIGRKLMRLNPARSCLRGSDRMRAIGTFTRIPPEKWLEAAGRLLTEAEEMRPGGEITGPRLLLLGSPHHNDRWELPRSIEDAGAIIVADDLCSGSAALPDPGCPDDASVDGMLDALADRSLMTSRCPCLSPNTNRLSRLRCLIEIYRADGVIYCAAKGCAAHQMESVAIQRHLSAAHKPLLRIESGDPDSPVKIKAFVKILKISGMGT